MDVEDVEDLVHGAGSNPDAGGLDATQPRRRTPKLLSHLIEMQPRILAQPAQLPAELTAANSRRRAHGHWYLHWSQHDDH
jgi:hypothetical protein